MSMLASLRHFLGCLQRDSKIGVQEIDGVYKAAHILDARSTTML